MRIRQTIHRPAFTLMELLVATALILFIMAIIAQMFGSGTKTFSNLRTAAQLSSNARAGINIIRIDLSREKFDTAGAEYLFKQRLDHPGWQPPERGYFEIRMPDPGGTAPVLFEPTSAGPLGAPDGESIYSTRATNHTLRFTMKIADDQTAPSDLLCAQYHPRFTGRRPGEPIVNAYPAFSPTLYTQWAEVCYFMLPTGQTTPTGLSIYNLRRRVRLMPKQSSPVFYLTAAEATQVEFDRLNNTYPDVIQPEVLGAAPPPYPAGTMMYRVPGPEELNREVGPLPRINFDYHPTGDDILLTDVLSFEAKAAWYYNPAFNSPLIGTVGSSPPPDRLFDAPVYTDEPFSVLKPTVFPGYTILTPGGRVFDTGRINNTVDWLTPIRPDGFGFLNTGPGRPPARINIRALQIKIRVWDPRAEQARQVTIVHEV